MIAFPIQNEIFKIRSTLEEYLYIKENKIAAVWISEEKSVHLPQDKAIRMFLEYNSLKLCNQTWHRGNEGPCSLSVVSGPAALLSPGSLLELWIPRSHPRPTEPECSSVSNSHMISMHSNFKKHYSRVLKRNREDLGKTQGRGKSSGLSPNSSPLEQFSFGLIFLSVEGLMLNFKYAISCWEKV